MKSQFQTRTFKKVSTVASLVALAMLYQNFNFADSLRVNLIPIDEAARTSHAREILGDNYPGSPAQLVENANSLGMAIFNDVYKSLPQDFKSSAIKLSTTILSESEKHEIDPVVVLAIIKTESTFNPKARGRHGEIGLMQLKPDTAEWIARKYQIPWKGAKSLENPSVNVRIGVAYLDYLRSRFDGHANKYLSAYNMGAANVTRLYMADQTPRQYSSKVLKNYNDIYRRLAAATTVGLMAFN